MNNFYVYGLIDPRNDSLFYIGKGKGNRFESHFKEKKTFNSNSDKISLIEELSKEGLDCKVIIFVKNINEDEAFALEKILIYRIGRRLFGEGVLTNIAPGGKWSKKDSYFFENQDITDTLDYLESKPYFRLILDRYPDISKKNSYEKLEKLYVYDKDIIFEMCFSFNDVLDKYGIEDAVKLLTLLKDNSEPVYAFKKIWCKYEITNIYDIQQIPFQNFDVLNLNFISNVNINFKKREDFSFEDENYSIVYVRDQNRLNFKAFYSNRANKYLLNIINNKLDGSFTSWYENGVVEKDILYSQNNIITEKFFYKNGNIESIKDMREDFFCLKQFYDNGKLKFENDKNGNSKTFFKNGEVKSISCYNGGNTLIIDYNEEGFKIRERQFRKENGLNKCHEKKYNSSGEIIKDIPDSKNFIF